MMPLKGVRGWGGAAAALTLSPPVETAQPPHWPGLRVELGALMLLYWCHCCRLDLNVDVSIGVAWNSKSYVPAETYLRAVARQEGVGQGG